MYRIIPDSATDCQIDLPSSKSITHRLFILAALNKGCTKISNALMSEDTKITQAALETMGAVFTKSKDSIIVSKSIGQTQGDEIYLGNSGSSARFLIPLGVFLDKSVRFYGSERLHLRPFSELLSAVKVLGHNLKSTDNSLPLETYPGHSTGGIIEFTSLPSSQVVTALMMAALKMKKNLLIRIPIGMSSLPYIKMTTDLMKRLRLKVDFSGNQIRVEAQQPNLDWTVSVEKDFSASSYWILFALINGVKVTLRNMSLPSLQGDEEILNIAQMVGADVMLYTDRVEIYGRIKRAFDVSCEDTPDLVPALSVLSLFTGSVCKLRNVKLLEYKESNRIQAIQENLTAIGGRSEYKDGDLTIIPQKHYRGEVIKSFNDHRIAMSFAVAGTRVPGIVIDDPGCVDKSYPGFWKDFTFWEKIV